MTARRNTNRAGSLRGQIVPPLSREQIEGIRKTLNRQWDRSHVGRQGEVDASGVQIEMALPDAAAIERRRRASAEARRNGVRLPEIADDPGASNSEAITHRHPGQRDNDGRSSKSR